MIIDYKNTNRINLMKNKNKFVSDKFTFSSLLSNSKKFMIYSTVGLGIFFGSGLLNNFYQNCWSNNKNVNFENQFESKRIPIIRKEIPTLEKLVDKNNINLENKLRLELKNKLDNLLEEKYISKFAYDDFLKNGNIEVYKLYKNKKISGFAFNVYVRANPVIDILKEGEKIFQTSEFKAIVGAESDFFPAAKSRANAIGMAQLTKGKYGGIEGLLSKRKRDVGIIIDVLDKKKVDNLVLKNYFFDSTKINLEDLGLKKKVLDGYNISKIELAEVIIPRYLAMKEIPFKDYSSQSIENDLTQNILAGNAHYFSGKLELSILAAQRKGKRIYFVDKSRNNLKNNPNFGAFYSNIDISSYAAYNAGVGALRKKYLRSVKNGSYNIDNYLAKETKIHRERIKMYARAFNELENYGVF